MDLRKVNVENVLTKSQIYHIAKKCVAETASWQLMGCEMRPAAEGMLGFGGDHFRLSLKLRVEGQALTIPLFVKSMPHNNAGSIKFIEEKKLFIKEMTVFKLIDEIETGPGACVARAFFCNEKVLVMPDLAHEGYSIRNQLNTFDLPHMLVAMASVARFHAATADLETRRALTLKRHYSFIEGYKNIFLERTIVDSPWIRAGAKLSANIIQHLSNKYRGIIPDLESNILRQFVDGCENLVESEQSLNVLLHMDLWVNNIMFKYSNGKPINAKLVDFQCATYGPPAFDVTVLLYLTTSRRFRREYEAEVLRHYFRIFEESVSFDTRLRMKSLRYDYEEFLRLVEQSRRFGMVVSLVVMPSVLLDSTRAGEVWGNPETFERLMYEDRSEIVLEQARICPEYGRRQLEVTEEFVERCLLSKKTAVDSDLCKLMTDARFTLGHECTDEAETG